MVAILKCMRESTTFTFILLYSRIRIRAGVLAARVRAVGAWHALGTASASDFQRVLIIMPLSPHMYVS
jgi:hypothetical protein